MWIASLPWALLTCIVFVSAQEYHVLDYGAKGDGVTNDTLAIKAAMQAAINSNGGRVVFAANYTFLTAPLDIATNMILDIRGELRGSPYDPDYYYLPQDLWWGPAWGPIQGHALLLARNVSNITITGGGIVNGVAENWNGKVGPFTLKLVYTNDSLIENITLYNCPRWTLNLGYCDNIHINHVNISNAISPTMAEWGTGISNDGFDFTVSNNILLENSFYTGGDNSILVQSGINNDGYLYGRPIENITVRNMVIWKGGSFGFSVGNWYARNITFDNITAYDMAGLIGASAYSGAWVDDVTFSNIHTTNSNLTATITNWNTVQNGSIRLENITNDASGAMTNWRNQVNWVLQGFNFTIRNVQVLNTKNGSVNYGSCTNVTGTCENVFPFCPCLLDQPPKWEYYNETNSSYAFLPQNVAYKDAEKYCNQYGGHLASIHSVAENNYYDLSSNYSFFLVKLRSNNTCRDFFNTLYIPFTVWIGFYDNSSQLDFQWTDQSSVEYTNWKSGSPSYDPHQCTYMWGSGGWDDRTLEWDLNRDPVLPIDLCTSALPFICKTLAQPTQPPTPAQPACPAQPAQQAQPAQPAQPYQPAQQYQPPQQYQPAQPAQLAQQAWPAQPAQ